MSNRDRGHRHRFRVAIVGVVLAAVASTLGSLAPAVARGTPAVLAASPVVLQAAPGDRDTFVPPPSRLSGLEGEPPSPDAASPSATIEITFGAGFPADAKVPVQAALNVWGSLVTSSWPITVHVDYSNLGAGTLAAAGPPFVYRDFPGARPNTWYPPALAEALMGEDISGSEHDVDISINSRDDWYFGTDGNTPSGRYDLMSVVLHEFLHGLGFLGTLRVSSGQGRWGLVPPEGGPALPDIYDRFTQDGNGTALLSYTSPSTSLANALQSNKVYFSSTATNRGVTDRVQLYAPNPWNSGSSFSHLDEDRYPAGSANSLGTPNLNSSEAVHAPGPLALCMLEALGWTTPESCVPPAKTQTGGFTWFSDGSFAGSGPAGTKVNAYATGAVPRRTYKLVSGLDGGPDWPCMWDTVPINPNNRVANSSGLIGTTGGTLDRGPGRWQVCFREEGTGNTLQVTVPATFVIR